MKKWGSFLSGLLISAFGFGQALDIENKVFKREKINEKQQFSYYRGVDNSFRERLKNASSITLTEADGTTRTIIIEAEEEGLRTTDNVQKTDKTAKDYTAITDPKKLATLIPVKPTSTSRTTDVALDEYVEPKKSLSFINTEEAVQEVDNTFKQEVSLYPNPTKGAFQIDFGETKRNVQVSIFNERGYLAFRNVYLNYSRISIQEDLRKGTYYLNLAATDEYATYKLIVE